MKLSRCNISKAVFVFFCASMVISLLTIIITNFSGFILEKPLMSKEEMRIPAIQGLQSILGLAVTARAMTFSAIHEEIHEIKLNISEKRPN